MKHHLLKASMAVVIGASALVGCGGDAADDDDFEKHTVADVQSRFKELTGIELRRAGSALGTTTLSLPIGGETGVLRQRYGGVQLMVASDEEAFERRRESTSGDRVLAVDNVLLRGGPSSDDGGFERAARIVSSLGKPASSVRLPPEDTPCARLRIDPDGGDSEPGTCLDGEQTVTVVDADDDLKLPTATISGLKQRVTRTLTTRRYGTARRFRAQGRFVLVTAKVENTSDEPLTRLPADLVINGRRYAPDSRNSYSIADQPFPIQPGGTATATFLFDIPTGADDPETGGALQFSMATDGYSSPERALAVGRIRLRPAESGSTGTSSR